MPSQLNNGQWMIIHAGENLENNRLTQEELAAKAGMKQSALARIEKSVAPGEKRR